jgi:hypothetical protein
VEQDVALAEDRDHRGPVLRCRDTTRAAPRRTDVTHTVDWTKLRDAMEMACEIRNVSMFTAGVEMGFSPSSLTRLRQGKHLSADNLAALVAWLYPQRIPHWVRSQP